MVVVVVVAVGACGDIASECLCPEALVVVGVAGKNVGVLVVFALLAAGVGCW